MPFYPQKESSTRGVWGGTPLFAGKPCVLLVVSRGNQAIRGWLRGKPPKPPEARAAWPPLRPLRLFGGGLHERRLQITAGDRLFNL